jgi:curved DNA-binding protein
MKYKDYYAILGVKRDAGADEIKTAYRRLARKYHPDVSKEKDAEEKFKEMAEAYETLKDPEKRAAYDQLGRHQSGEEFRPPPDWGEHFAQGQGAFDDIDLSDLFAGIAGRQGRGGGGRRADRPMAGSDYEAVVRISFEQAFHGTEVDLELSVLEWDPDGGVRRVPHRVKARIPRGVTDGEKLRVPGKGGKGANGGPDGDLYLDIEVQTHPFYRVDGQDLYVDLPLAPWEAVLGTSVKLPTPAGAVTLKVAAGTRAGQRLRLAGRGMARGKSTPGHLYAMVRIEVPTIIDDKQRKLYEQLAETSNFTPHAQLEQEAAK